ncbi:MAG TPA: outer membrane beta-barrel protein [Kiritimatiellia bacterium]|nr:outer membrane beta-barrel protein [Kiritimatiellia bacterium]HMO98279.1 outer membrane beta-barrel protein [Kiritimatiellia bacterium]HMP96276.1 outer membrane beta-barrel protein [Kiritimatiellia bacterium]
MRLLKLLCIGACSVALTGWSSVQAAERDLFEDAPWYIGLGVGHFNFEGDAVVQDDFFVGLRLGYDLNKFFGLEFGVDYAPSLDNTVFPDQRYSIDDDASLIRLSFDVLLHLRNTQNLRWDPYLALGAGYMRFSEAVNKDGDKGIFGLHGGAGLFYHFSDAWAVRGDFRTTIASENTEFAAIVFVGVNYRWGTAIAPKYTLSGGDLDSDGDGLTDAYEMQIGTNPFDPDTDKDGLSDGEEVLVYKTDPLNPDTDWDGLTDGAEVLVYKTDPLNPDTDGGGVRDGHEVIEDGTDPLDPSDDLQLFTLNIEFDYDKHFLRPQYHADLDVVVKVLQRDPGATARIEGHADRRRTSKHDYNMRLSERRANSVLSYIADVGGISRSRLTAVGYGFTRPVAPNDTEVNMQKNRRTEIYIRKGNQQEISPTGQVIDLKTDAPVAP